MFFRQYDLACLSLFSYLIGDTTTGRAVVVDPQRDISEYLADAERRRAAHRAGDRDPLPRRLPLRPPRAGRGHRRRHLLRRRRRARLPDRAAGPRPAPVARRGRRSRSATRPATRPSRSRSSCYEHPDAEPWAVLTGDTLFIGDVGRPDLLTSVGWTADDLARRPVPLAARAAAHPARRHARLPGPRRRLGLRQAPVRPPASSTIGEQRATNYALAPDDRGRSSSRPSPRARAWRRSTSPSRPTPTAASASCSTTTRPRPRSTVDEALDRADAGAVLLDTRSPGVLRLRALRGSINVGLDGRFAEYAGDVVRPGQQVVLLGDAGRRHRGQGPPGPHRLRRRRRRGPRRRGRARRPARARRHRPPPARADVAAWLADDPDLQVVDVRNPGETAARRHHPRRPQPAPSPSCSTTSTTSTATRRPSCTAPAATARRSPRRPCGPTASRIVADLIGGYRRWVDGA